MDRRRFLNAAVWASTGIGSGGGEERNFGFGELNAVIPLDGEWRIATDPKNEERAKEWFARPFPSSEPVRVPGTIQDAFPVYFGLAWYERNFRIPENGRSPVRYLLRFDNVDYLADVWVNGTAVGGHEGSQTPFTLDISGATKPNLDNRLVVRVLNTTEEPIDGLSLHNTPNEKKRFPWNWGGIMGSVELLVAPLVQLQNIVVRPNAGNGEISLDLSLFNSHIEARTGTFGHLGIPRNRKPGGCWNRSHLGSAAGRDRCEEQLAH